MFEKLKAYFQREFAEAYILVFSTVFAKAFLNSRFAQSRRGIAVEGLIALAVGVMMLGILLPIGLSAWEDYTPTDATLVIIWPIGAVLIVLAVVLNFFKDNS